MIELKHDNLVFSFPGVHRYARMEVDFQRTLRIPDDGTDYPLPPGLGSFPLRHVDDFSASVPADWVAHGGVMLPMYQSEALWLNFDSTTDRDRGVSYPFAVKIATGKLCAVSGKTWKDRLSRRPQDYLVVPEQPWLDGYCVEKGIIRQFVAMPLGAGYTAEEQVTGKAEHGGLQIMVCPMKREVYERRFPKCEREKDEDKGSYMCCDSPPMYSMGLAPGGRMKQDIYDDPYRLSDWDTENTSRCFVHIANSMVWRSITGDDPPTTPPTAEEYTHAGMPWFDWYDDQNTVVYGSSVLAGMKSVAELGKEKGDVPLPENASVAATRLIELRSDLKTGQVREWSDSVTR